jgi:hypothetical protein
MSHPTLSKFIFNIRTKTGVLVDNLQISAISLEAAERNLKQMYIKCEILSTWHLDNPQNNPTKFEDVLNIIVQYE